MTALYILLGVVLVLLLLSRVRVGGGVEYTRDGFTARVRVGPARIQVFPVRKKREKKEKPPKPKKQKKEKPDKGREHPKGGMVELLLAMLPVVLETVKKFARSLRADELEIILTVSSADPADTAALYGQANAVLGSLWYPITNALHVVDGHARVEADFQSEQMTVYLRAALSLTIGQAVCIGLLFAGKALSTFFRVQRENKRRKAV